MIGRGFLRSKPAEEPSGFESFELRLGDLMRGERATLGKTLADVQRELKIKGAYIAAIENADPSAFDTPGFIAGYVRSYARYLNMDPDWAFETFCQESGFATPQGMSAEASSPRAARAAPAQGIGKDIFAGANARFLPAAGGVVGSLDLRALGSVLVLAAVLGGIGWGGWTVLREVQKVTFAPVEQAPSVVADLDPLAGNANLGQPDEVAGLQTPSAEALDRLYRPEALDVPVLVPRDGPIAALDPRRAGGADVVATMAAARPGLADIGPAGAPAGASAGAPAAGAAPVDGVEQALAEALGVTGAAGGLPGAPPGAGLPQVTAGAAPAVQLVAARPAWVRVQAADGSTLFEGILEPGDTFDVPQTVEPATLRVGESGALYMALGGVPYGPVGPSGQVTSNVALSAESIAQAYQVADLAADTDLAAIVRVAQADLAPPASPLDGAPAPAEAPLE